MSNAQRSFTENQLVTDANLSRFQKDFPDFSGEAEALDKNLRELDSLREDFTSERSVINARYSALEKPKQIGEHASIFMNRLKSMQAASDRALNEQIEGLKEKLSETPEQVSELMETRAADKLETMDETARMDAYLTALNRGDSAVVQAIRNQSKTFPLIRDLAWIRQMNEQNFDAINPEVNAKLRMLQNWQTTWDSSMASLMTLVRNDLPDDAPELTVL